MAPPVTWIERGPDGRPYFVRKKSKLPSARELLADAFAPLRKSSSPFSRAHRRYHHIVPAPWNTPLYLPASPLPPANFATTLPLPNNLPSFGTNGIAMDHPRGILKPQPQHYAVPHPTMYPAPPQHVLPTQHPVFGTLPHRIPGQIQYIPTQASGAYPSQPLPPGARIISPPRYPTAEELKYKCSICGRFRSARYHYKHPLPSGQLPGKTVCRKCREQATDSEDSVSTSIVPYRKHRRPRGRSHGHVRSRSRAGSVDTTRRRATSRRGRSISREDWSDDEYEDEVREMRRSHSRSGSLEYLPLRSFITSSDRHVRN
jgi:hypothetical protein